MKYYKVVRKTWFGLYSSFVSDIWGMYVRYKVGKWVKPKIKNTKLFVFTNIETAIDYASYQDWVDFNQLAIYECEVKNPEVQYEKYVDSYKTLKMISGFPRAISSALYYWSDEYVIPDTVFCDEVKLIRKVS